MKHRTINYLKISTALCFLLLSFALITLRSLPLDGYETSVYTATPPVFWLATILGIINGLALFYHSYEKNNKLWALGLFQIILCNSLIICLSALRGYFFFGRFDSLSYIAYAKDIVLLGFAPIQEYNFYPGASLFLASTSQVTNLPIINIARFTSALFFAFYLLSIFIWSRSISRDPKFVTSMVLVSIPIFFAWFIAALFHEALAALMLPFLFFSLQRGRTKGDPKFRFIAYALIFILVLWHPLVSIYVLAFLVIILVVEWLTKRTDKLVTLPMVVFASVALFSWISTQNSMINSLRSTILQMLGQREGSTTLSVAENLAGQLNLLDLARQVMLSAFDDLIFYLLAAALVLFLLRKKRWRVHPLTPIAACLVGGTLMLGFMLVTSMVHNPLRLINLNFTVILAIPLVGFVLYSLRKQGRKRIARLVTGLILISFVVSVLSAYPSQLTMNPNDMVLRSEVSGNNWFISEKNIEKGVWRLQTDPARYADFILGHYAIVEQPESVRNELHVTPHFESNGSEIGLLEVNQSAQGNYVIISSYDQISYTQVWNSTNRFNDADFQALDISPTTGKVYENGDIRFYVYL